MENATSIPVYAQRHELKGEVHRHNSKKVVRKIKSLASK